MVWHFFQVPVPSEISSETPRQHVAGSVRQSWNNISHKEIYSLHFRADPSSPTTFQEQTNETTNSNWQSTCKAPPSTSLPSIWQSLREGWLVVGNQQPTPLEYCQNPPRTLSTCFGQLFFKVFSFRSSSVILALGSASNSDWFYVILKGDCDQECFLYPCV